MNTRGAFSWNAVIISVAILVAGGMIAMSLRPRGPDRPEPIAAVVPPPLDSSEPLVAEVDVEEAAILAPVGEPPASDFKASNFVESAAVRFAGLPSTVKMLEFSADGRYLLACSALETTRGFTLSGPSKAGQIALWEVPSGRLAWTKVAMHGDEPCDVARVALSPDGTEVWASFSYTFEPSSVGSKTRCPLFAWNWSRDEAIHVNRLPEAIDESSGKVRNGVLRSLAFDGKSVIVARSWQERSMFSSEEWGFDRLDASSLNSLVSTPSIVKSVSEAVAIDRQSRMLAVTLNVPSWIEGEFVMRDKVLVYDLMTGIEQNSLDLDRTVRQLAFNGPQMLLVADDGAVYRWAVADREAEKVFTIENFPEYAMVAIDHDGRQVAVLNRDATIDLWDLESGLQTASITLADRPSSSSQGFVFSPSGDMLAIGGNEGGIFLWSRDLPAEAIGTASLTEAQPAPELVEPPPGDPTLWRQKWVGTWNEPYPLVGTRTIITLTETGDGLAGTWSDPAPPNGTRFNFRIPEQLSGILQVDEWTLTCRRGKQTLTLRFVPGEYGAGPSMHVDTDGKGTIGALLGTPFKTAILKKE